MMKPIKTILYATDLSTTSNFAFRYAVGLAKAVDARLHVMHALEPMNEEARITLQMFMIDANERNQAINRRLQNTRAALNERQEAFWAEMPEDERGERARVDDIEVVEGYAADAILKRADSLPADMILMGSHAHGLTHSFLGTIAKRVLHRAKVPTLIVPYSEHQERKDS